jgi:putative nucleotidyltransferase with HDIG domain
VNELAARFLRELLDDLEHKRLTLPTLPEVALRVRDIVNDERSSVGDLSRVIATDAALSARIIQVANSPLMRPSRPIESVDAAVTRLGMKLVRDLATSIVMKQIFQATTDLTEKKLRRLWEHSTSVAAIAHVLAAQFTRLQPAQAMLAGLVHDIGALPVLAKAEDFPELLEDEAALDRVLREVHPQLGAAILTSWNFPPELVAVAASHDDLAYDSAAPDYVDVVIVANLQSYLDTDHPLAAQAWGEVPAFAKLGLSTDVSMIDIADAASNIAEAQQFLQG